MGVWRAKPGPIHWEAVRRVGRAGGIRAATVHLLRAGPRRGQQGELEGPSGKQPIHQRAARTRRRDWRLALLWPRLYDESTACLRPCPQHWLPAPSPSQSRRTAGSRRRCLPPTSLSPSLALRPAG